MLVRAKEVIVANTSGPSISKSLAEASTPVRSNNKGVERFWSVILIALLLIKTSSALSLKILAAFVPELNFPEKTDMLSLASFL